MYSQIDRRQLPLHFRALASPTRLHILERLAERGELSVKQLAAALRMSQPRVSWHLAMLRRGGAVRTRKEGRQVHCSLDLEGIRRGEVALWELLSPIRQHEEFDARYDRGTDHAEPSEHSAAAAQD